MASSSSATVIHSERKYDVFLNFRGHDTRKTFTSHLYKALDDKKINTYIDYKIDKGGEIAPALLQAIEGSKISVIIFSEHYASSTWCLDELVHILKCKERNDAAYVIPIFYKIEPADIRFQKGNYELEERFKDKVETERRLKWKDALRKASNLSGFHSTSSTVRDESDLIEQIVKDILKKLSRCEICAKPKSSSHLKGFFRGEGFIQQIDPFLSSVQFLPQDDLVRSAFTDASLCLTPPFDALSLSTIEVLHNLPKKLVRLNQTDIGRILLFMLVATIPYTFIYITCLAYIILLIYIWKNFYIYNNMRGRLEGLQGEAATSGHQFSWVSDLYICLSCIVCLLLVSWVDNIASWVDNILTSDFENWGNARSPIYQGGVIPTYTKYF